MDDSHPDSATRGHDDAPPVPSALGKPVGADTRPVTRREIVCAQISPELAGSRYMVRIAGAGDVGDAIIVENEHGVRGEIFIGASAKVREDGHIVWSEFDGFFAEDDSLEPAWATKLRRDVRALRCGAGQPFQEDWLDDVVVFLPPMCSLQVAAAALSVSVRTVQRMIDRGEVEALDLSQRGTGEKACWRIPRAEIAKALRRKRR